MDTTEGPDTELGDSAGLPGGSEQPPALSLETVEQVTAVIPTGAHTQWHVFAHLDIRAREKG